MKRSFFLPWSFWPVRIFFPSFAALLLCTSCKKFVTVPSPLSQVTTATLFTDSASATSAINGLYSQMMNSNLFLANGGITVFTGLTSDELYNPSANASLDPYTSNAILPTDPTTLYNRLWLRAYNYIYQANRILEGLTASTTLTAGVKANLAGEAKLVRAFCYFYLVNLFGDVPLTTTSDYLTNQFLGRSSVTQVFDQVVSDTKAAEGQLPTAYPSLGRTRPTKMAATAFLARVYLYRQQWAEAETAASIVLSSSTYVLQPNPVDVFTAPSTEAIWQLLPVNVGFNTGEGNAFIPASATVKPTYALTSFLLAAFESGDSRKAAWTKSNTVGGQTFFYPAKYKVRTSTALTEYNTVLRLGEQYLIRAEARAQQDNLSGALADLYKIRSRAALPPSTATTKGAILLAIEKERQVELFAEWGHRWFDLKRTGRISTVLGVEKPSWVSTAALFPIPLSEILTDGALSQNPGY